MLIGLLSRLDDFQNYFFLKPVETNQTNKINITTSEDCNSSKVKRTRRNKKETVKNPEQRPEMNEEPQAPSYARGVVIVLRLRN
jgi:hypothetical protein